MVVRIEISGLQWTVSLWRHRVLSGQRLAFDGKGLEVKGYIVWSLMLCVLEIPKGARAGREKFLLDYNSYSWFATALAG